MPPAWGRGRDGRNFRHCDHRRGRWRPRRGDAAPARRPSRRRLRALRRLAPDRLRTDAAADRPRRAGRGSACAGRSRRLARGSATCMGSTNAAASSSISLCRSRACFLRRRRSSRRAACRALGGFRQKRRRARDGLDHGRRRRAADGRAQPLRRQRTHDAGFRPRRRRLRRALFACAAGDESRPRANSPMARSGRACPISGSRRRRSPSAMSRRES